MAPGAIRRTAILCSSLILAGCTEHPARESEDSRWQGSISREQGVTRVVNRSGSLWGDAPALREELSIGVAEGAEPYLFGDVADLWATDDRLYVVDSQVPAVRVYDLDGRHLFDIGSEGEGPGEFREPTSIVVTGAGQVVVAEAGPRVHRFDPEGAHLESWDTGGAWHVFTDGLLLGNDGSLFKVAVDRRSIESAGGRLPRLGWRQIGTGTAPIFPPPVTTPDECLRYDGATGEQEWCGLPWAKRTLATFTPAGEWVVGRNHAYRFEVRRPDGDRLRVERSWSPVQVSEPEREYHRARIRALLGSRNSRWSWQGGDVSDRKPPFDRIVADRSGRLWLRREGESVQRRHDCTKEFENPRAARTYSSCWVAPFSWDVFAADGRFLGEVEEPAGVRFTVSPFARDDRLAVALQGRDGVVRVKLYRLQSSAAIGRAAMETAEAAGKR